MISLELMPDLPIASYDYIVINTSGGKDSQAMMDAVTTLADSSGIPRSKIIAVHSDLGRCEWNGTTDLVKAQCDHYGIKNLIIVRRTQDLLDHIEARGMFPSSKTRYCTSDHKRDQIAKIFTQIQRDHGPGEIRILNCMGIRAEESPARAKKQAEEPNKRSSTKSRHVTNWLPIFDWKETKVWEVIHASGAPYHQAYDLGMPRLSCVFCIFAPKEALLIAGAHNPELLEEYVQVERKIDHTFRKDLSLADIQSELKTGLQATSPVKSKQPMGTLNKSRNTVFKYVILHHGTPVKGCPCGQSQTDQAAPGQQGDGS